MCDIHVQSIYHISAGKAILPSELKQSLEFASAEKVKERGKSQEVNTGADEAKAEKKVEEKTREINGTIHWMQSL